MALLLIITLLTGKVTEAQVDSLYLLPGTARVFRSFPTDIQDTLYAIPGLSRFMDPKTFEIHGIRVKILDYALADTFPIGEYTPEIYLLLDSLKEAYAEETDLLVRAQLRKRIAQVEDRIQFLKENRYLKVITDRGEGEVHFNYLVRRVDIRPYYELVVNTRNTKASLNLYALVSQRTGERWNTQNLRVIFDTQEPNLSGHVELHQAGLQKYVVTVPLRLHPGETKKKMLVQKFDLPVKRISAIALPGDSGIRSYLQFSITNFQSLPSGSLALYVDGIKISSMDFQDVSESWRVLLKDTLVTFFHTRPIFKTQSKRSITLKKSVITRVQHVFKAKNISSDTLTVILTTLYPSPEKENATVVEMTLSPQPERVGSRARWTFTLPPLSEATVKIFAVIEHPREPCDLKLK